jgi:hypothetical protein
MIFCRPFSKNAKELSTTVLMADFEYREYWKKVRPTFTKITFTEEEERKFKEKIKRCGVDDVRKRKFMRLCGVPLEEGDVSGLMDEKSV